MLTLTRTEIEAAIDLNSAAPMIEQAFRDASAGRITLPPVGHITFPDDADCHIKYGHQKGADTFVIKIATGFPVLAAKGLPTGNGCVLVLSARTGAPLAMFHDEMLLTDVRTGIGGAIATRALARSDAVRVLICGTGAQARWQIQAHRALIGNHLEFSVWGRDRQKVFSICEQMRTTPSHDIERDVQASDVIVTATAATRPLFAQEWVRPGTHITAVGADAPGKQELDPALVRRADILVADSADQCLDHGEFSHSNDVANRVNELGDVLDLSPLRPKGAISIADLTGIAAQDIAMATAILQNHEGLDATHD